jgi:DNA/RNA endonuclease G (NUC1)
MKKSFVYALTAAILMSSAFSCEVVYPDNGVEDGTEVTPTPEPEPEPDPEPGQDPTPDPDPVPEPEKPAYYVKVSEDFSDWTGDYIIAYSSGTSVKVLNSWSGEDKGASTVDLGSKVTVEGIPAEEADAYKAVFEKCGSGYSVYVTGLGYIGCASSDNTLSKQSAQPSASDTKYQWTVSYKDGYDIWLKNVSYSTRRLQWNASASIFRCYTGSQKEITLYRRSTSSSENNSRPDPEPDPDPTPEPDPTPDPDPTPEPDTPTVNPTPDDNCPYGWYELPAINYSAEGSSYHVSQSDKYGKLYYAHHICNGGEKYKHAPYTNTTMRNYTVCFSAEHHCPVWVAAPRHKRYESGASRTDAYSTDPKIPSNIQYSSKSTGGGCNKGHMLGSAERLSTTATNKQVFYYSNIAPQYSDTFNTGGGAWNNLEDWVDGHVCSDTLYVVIGAYFDQYTDKRGTSASPKRISFGGRSDVSCPTMFYYALLRTKKGNTGKPLSQCSTGEIQCVALVRSHKTAKGTKDFATDMMSISDLEKITGFTYFPNVPNAPKSSYQASDWGL